MKDTLSSIVQLTTLATVTYIVMCLESFELVDEYSMFIVIGNTILVIIGFVGILWKRFE